MVHYESNGYFLWKKETLIVAVQMLKILRNALPQQQYTCGDLSVKPGSHPAPPRQECLLGTS